MTDGEFSSVWPEPTPEQIEVMLLGTYHMDNPGLDTVNVDADDVLTPSRQRELEDLADRLEPWNPAKIAVERPYDTNEPLNEQYHRYRSGEWAYDNEIALDPLHPSRADTQASCRSEVIQIGFRLADRCDHDEIYPVDSPMTLGNGHLADLEARDFDPPTKTDIDLPTPEDIEREFTDELASSTIPEYLDTINREGVLRRNHQVMFGEYLRWGEADNFGGPDALATWYKRNLRIVHNVWRAVDPGDDRVFLLIGSGHVRALRQLFVEIPQFVPVSPRPLLATDR